MQYFVRSFSPDFNRCDPLPGLPALRRPQAIHKAIAAAALESLPAVPVRAIRVVFPNHLETQRLRGWTVCGKSTWALGDDVPLPPPHISPPPRIWPLGPKKGQGKRFWPFVPLLLAPPGVGTPKGSGMLDSLDILLNIFPISVIPPCGFLSIFLEPGLSDS